MNARKRIAAALAACMLACGTAGAESVTAQVQSLADLTAAAAMDGSGQLRTLEPGASLDSDFVYELFTRGQKGSYDVGITADMLLDPQLQAAWLKDHFVSEPGELAGILWFEEEQPRVSVAVTKVEESDAGDAAVIFGEIRQGDQRTGLCVRIDVRRDAPDGGNWKIERFAMDSEGREELADQLFVSSMVEYVSPELGFSVLYPALFADVMEEHDSSIDGRLADGSAAFYVNMTPQENRAGETPELVIAGLQEAHPGVEVEVSEATGMILARWQENGMTVCRGYYVTEDVLCMARVAWDPVSHPEMDELSGYMMNSLAIDALGVG